MLLLQYYYSILISNTARCVYLLFGYLSEVLSFSKLIYQAALLC